MAVTNTPDKSEMRADPERIWLQPRCCASEHEGRLWCEDKVFDDCEDGNEPTEYVRADLSRPPADQVPDMVERVALAIIRADQEPCPDYPATISDHPEVSDWGIHLAIAALQAAPQVPGLAAIIFKEFGKIPTYKGPDDPCDDPVTQGYGNALTNVLAALQAVPAASEVGERDA